VYFCATTPNLRDSTLASNGVVLYVLVQRALAAGASVLGGTRQMVAGEVTGERPTAWRKIAGPAEALSIDYGVHAGVYGEGEKLLALNRAAVEDQSPVLPEPRLAELFRGLDFSRVDDQAGNLTSLIQEIWRAFLLAMLVALIAEAILCLPRRSAVTGTAV
jgi:hypothetical protein